MVVACLCGAVHAALLCFFCANVLETCGVWTEKQIIYIYIYIYSVATGMQQLVHCANRLVYSPVLRSSASRRTWLIPLQMPLYE